MSKTRRIALGAVLAGVATAVAGVGLAVATTSNPTIYACAKKRDGGLRAVTGPGACSSSEYLLEWNKQGRPGEPGDQGPPGEQGPPGPPGSLPVYESVESGSWTSSEAAELVYARCDPGDLPLSGAHKLVFDGVGFGFSVVWSTPWRPAERFPEEDPETQAWTVLLFRDDPTGGLTATVDVRAVCLDLTPMRD
jgi:hypothetical protein